MQYHPRQIGDEKVRYALIQEGKRMLFIVGLNPSIADADKPDPTMRSAMRIAEYNGYDGFVMINLYSLRATAPKNLPKECDTELHKRNLKCLEDLLRDYNQVDVWLAYGANINRRTYLFPSLRDIIKVFEPHNPQWLYINTLTAEGHPRHPLYQKADYFKVLTQNNINALN